MATYAAGTNVSSDRSRDEIERILERWGADQFAYGRSGERAMIGFVVHDRQIRFTVEMPDKTGSQFTRTPTGRARSRDQATDAWSQAVRERWRALALVIKAKLAAVDSGIVTFEQEFLAHTVMPDGRTVADHVLPAVEAAYLTGTVSPLLQIERD